MRRLLLISWLLLGIGQSVGEASSFCVNSCVNKGYGLNGCVAYCDQQQGLFEALPTPQRPTRTAPRIDYQCLQDCQTRYTWGYCQQACQY